MATHTWNFKVYLGRSYGKNSLSGVPIAAYTTRTGSTLLASGTTNSSGQFSYSSTSNPTSFYWRVSPPDDSFLKLYAGKNIVAVGSTSGCYSNPTVNYNVSGTAVVSAGYTPNNASGKYSVSVYLYFVTNGVSLQSSPYSSKFITIGDIIGLLPPGKNLNSTKYNACAVKSDVSSYLSRSYFYGNGVNNNVTNDSQLIMCTYITGYDYFISGTSTVSMSEPSTFSTFPSGISTQSQTITLYNCYDNFDLNVEISNSSYFSATTTKSGSGANRTYTVKVSTRSSNTASTQRSSQIVYSIVAPDRRPQSTTSYYYAGTFNGGTSKTIWQASGTTSGGGTGGGGVMTTALLSIGEFDEI